MLEVSGPCSFIYNLAVAHCSTRPRHPCNRTKTSPVQTTCIHSTRNFTPESRSSCWCLWDIQFWLTARVGHIQPLALNQPRILAQRRVTNFTWHSMTRALDPSTLCQESKAKYLMQSWAESAWILSTTTSSCSVYTQESLVWVIPVFTRRFRCNTARGF